MKRLFSAVVAATTAAILITACGKDSPQSIPPPDPTQIAGKPITEIPSGLRPNAPGPTRPIDNSDGGDLDRIAALSIADIEQFWPGAYAKPLEGKFAPVNAVFSWDSRFKNGKFCGNAINDFYNAQWCDAHGNLNCPTDGSSCLESYNSIGWDRGGLMPDERKIAGDLGVTMVLAHEYGHAITWGMAGGIEGKGLNVDVASEQQADCYAGVYIRWVVDGKSPRFTLNTGEGLTNLLVVMVALRDRLLQQSDPGRANLYHGSAFERVTAFQFGFNEGVSKCASIDASEVAERRDKLPKGLLEQSETGEVPINKDSVNANVEALTKVFPLANPPHISFDPPACPDAKPTPPATYCPSTNTIAVDMNRLILMGTSLTRGTPLDPKPNAVFGDYTSYSILASRYMLAAQQAKGGLALDNTDASLRTACLTGAATTKMSKDITLGNGAIFRLTGGDLDEAVTGLLTNGLAAANTKGESAPSAFARVDAFRRGVLGDDATCYTNWP